MPGAFLRRRSSDPPSVRSERIPRSAVASQNAAVQENRRASVHGTTSPGVKPISASCPASPASYRQISPGAVIETNKVVKTIDGKSGLKFVNNYCILRELGRGVHGKVKLARNSDTGVLAAIKILRRSSQKRPRTPHMPSSSTSFGAEEEREEVEVEENDPTLMEDQNAPKQHNSLYFGLGKNLSNEKIQREIAILKKCTHPNIVQLYEVIDNPSCGKVYIVLEYLPGGELVWSRDDKPVLSLDAARAVFRDVVVGLEFLHTIGIVHRDIKPANLLRAENNTVKLSDFGVSHFSPQQHMRELRELALRRNSSCGQKKDGSPDYTPLDSFQGPSNQANAEQTTLANSLKKSSSSQNPLSKTPRLFSGRFSDAKRKKNASTSNNSKSTASSKSSKTRGNHMPPIVTRDEQDEELGKTAGSPAFFAPELCILSENPNDRKPVSKAIDVWALGVTLYCLCFGVCPFVAKTEYELFEIIPKQKLTFPEDAEVPDDLNDLFSRVLEKDPRKRITLEKVKRHAWTLSGLPSPVNWLFNTDPMKYANLDVSEEEVRNAVTSVADKIRRQLRRFSVTIHEHIATRLRRMTIAAPITKDQSDKQPESEPIKVKSVEIRQESGSKPEAVLQRRRTVIPTIPVLEIPKNDDMQPPCHLTSKSAGSISACTERFPGQLSPNFQRGSLSSPFNESFPHSASSLRTNRGMRNVVLGGQSGSRDTVVSSCGVITPPILSPLGSINLASRSVSLASCASRIAEAIEEVEEDGKEGTQAPAGAQKEPDKAKPNQEQGSGISPQSSRRSLRRPLSPRTAK